MKKTKQKPQTKMQQQQRKALIHTSYISTNKHIILKCGIYSDV